MPEFPDNVTRVRVRGYYWAQTGGGVLKQVHAAPTITTAVDSARHGWINLAEVTVTADPETGYFFIDLVPTNDPDLTPEFRWKLSAENAPTIEIEVPYDAPTVDVGGGVTMPAIWFTDAATSATPPPPPEAYYTATQTNSVIQEYIEDAESGAVVSVAGRTGAVVLTKTDVGLPNVDNTSDAGKPVSTATQTALDGKQASDADLTAFAALTPANDDVVQRKAGAWTNRTMAQLKTDLALTALVSSVTAANGTITVAGTATDPTIAVGDIPASDVTSGTLDIARIPTGTSGTTVCIGNDGRLSDARTPTAHTHSGADIGSGTVAAARLPLVKDVPVTLTDAATVATDASLGNYFRCSMAGNRTFSPPSNPTDGQKILYELTASAADRTPVFTTGSAGAFAFGTDITSASIGTISSGTTALVGAIYRASVDRWRVTAVAKGY